MKAGRARSGSTRGRSEYRAVVAAVIACLCFVVLMVAASSGPVDLGRVPPSPSDTVAPVSTTPAVTEAESNEVPNEPPGLFEVPENAFVAALVGVVVVVFGIYAVYALILTLAQLLPFLRRRPRSARTNVVALPEVAQPIELDVDAQLTALAHGEPRNAIVACWLRLEDDVAAAGLPRHAAETSAEFTTRVLTSYSLDPTPVNELAALYREARFSVHPMEQIDRDRALTALRRVHAAIAHPTTSPSAVEA